MSAEVALQMGLPIYGIVGLTSTATDKEGRSVPAPGRGILTTAREASHYTSATATRMMPKMMDLSYRRTRLQRALRHIDECYKEELAEFQDDLDAVKQQLLQQENHSHSVSPTVGTESTGGR